MEDFLIKYLIFSLFPIFSLIFMVYSFFKPDFLKGINIDKESNEYCLLNSSNLICKNEYKKRKFIWIFLDGNAFDQLVLLRNKSNYGFLSIFEGKEISIQTLYFLKCFQMYPVV